ncbi:MAG: regulatory protein RecX [Candidatus Latescibacteria bacterium]|nr:regulatory protein RecX [Candidatus Latescibacterota bacterium]
MKPNALSTSDRRNSAERAKNEAFKLLSARAYSCAEVRERLRRRGFQEPLVEQTLDELRRLKLVDDRDYALRLVQERMRIRPAGRALLRHDLKKRGIDSATAQDVLDEVFEGVDPEVVALDLLRSRRRHYDGVDRRKALSRMYGFLGRRGFGAVAHAAAQRAWLEFSESGHDGAPDS